jgi:hypothetical protein
MNPDDQNANAAEVKPTIDDEMAATKAVLDALIKLLSRDAQGRVLHHAYQYLGIGPRW